MPLGGVSSKLSPPAHPQQRRSGLSLLECFDAQTSQVYLGCFHRRVAENAGQQINVPAGSEEVHRETMSERMGGNPNSRDSYLRGKDFEIPQKVSLCDRVPIS